MAIITEEPTNGSNPQPRLRKAKSTPIPKPEPERKPKPKPKSEPEPTAPPPSANPFHFWFYFTISVSLITLFFVLLSSLRSQDPKSWFLDLPHVLRQHYSNGRIIKVQISPNQPQIELFSIQQGHANSDSSNVLIVHGLGLSSFAFRDVVKFLGSKNVHAVAIDLPGSGFSDKSVVVVEESVGESTGLAKLWEVYGDIKEKGIFWGFDQLVEQGYVDLEESVVYKERVKAIELGSEEMGRVLGQVVDTLGLAPIDLVLHDSALGLSANWIAENRGLVRSVVVLDSVGVGAAFPVWVLGMPLVREVVLGFRFVFERVLAKCCVKSVGPVEADAHRVLLKGRDGARAVFGMGKMINCSFDLSEWSALDGVKGLPVRVVTGEGYQISDAFPEATRVTHSGGRWTQEHNAEEVAESIYEFVSSLPKPSRPDTEEPVPEHLREMLHNSESHDQHHHHHNHGHGGHGHHDHAHAGYDEAYGLGQGWSM